MKKSCLALAVLCACTSLGFVAEVEAADTMKHEMNEVVIEGQKDLIPGGFASKKGSVGILGTKDIMEVPFAQVNLSQKTINAFAGPNQPLHSVLINNPSVRVEGTNLHNDISIRGMIMNGTSMYVNGIPGLTGQFNVPMIAFSDVQFISGPNTGLTGIPNTAESDAAGGIVNFVTKKATADNQFKYKQTFSGQSSWGEYLDISERFGKDNEWGVRVNTEVLDGETAIDNNKIKARGIYANIDHQDDNSKSNMFVGYRDKEIVGGMRWFYLENVGVADKNGNIITKLPEAPDASNDLGFDGMNKRTEGYMIAMNHEQKFDEGWKWFANAGMNDSELKRNTTGMWSTFTIINDKGDIGPVPHSGMANKIFSTRTEGKRFYGQLGMNGEFETGVLKHDLTLAADRVWSNGKGTVKNYRGEMGSAHGNIYEGGIIVDGFWQPDIQTRQGSKSYYWGVSLADTITLDKAQVLLGIHKHAAQTNVYSKGVLNRINKSDATCPTYGLLYRPDEHISLYASHSENFDKGEEVAYGWGYENEGDILPAAKTKQNEIGVKYANADFIASLGVFDVTQANNIDVKRDGKWYYLQDGERSYQGVDLSINGKIAPKWNFMGGFMYVDVVQEKTAGGYADGKKLPGTPDWNAVATLEYEASDDFSVLGRAFYNGHSRNNGDMIYIPSYVVYDLGVNYKTHIKDIPVNLTAMCYNVTGKDYWTPCLSAVLLNNPRTFMVSAEFEI